MDNIHQAYEEAQKIDNVINKLLVKTPITKENVREWGTFVRTIKTTITMLEKIIERTDFTPEDCRKRHGVGSCECCRHMHEACPNEREG